MALPPDGITAIILAIATAEAFINELPEALALYLDSDYLPLPDRLRGFVDALRVVEERRESLLAKYLMASEVLAPKPFAKGANPYQDFAILFALRNDLMHLKPRESSKHMECLDKRGFTFGYQSDVDWSWFDRLSTAAIAGWACDTAKAMIWEVLKLVVEDDNHNVVTGFRGVLSIARPEPN